MSSNIGQIIMTKGLPGSGKSTWAREYVLTHPGSMRLNKDELREMLHAGKHTKYNEKQVLQYRDALTRLALAAKKTVIVDDTNLNPIHQETMAKIAEEYRVPLVIQSFMEVPLDECIMRDKKRDKMVGEKVIRGMYNQYVRKAPVMVEWDETLPSCILCDIDGTLALFGNENPYERDFSKDQVNTPVAYILDTMSHEDRPDDSSHPMIILMSGRSGKFEKQTREWLEAHSIPYDELHMRAEGDTRKDSVVKQELYEAHIKGKYNVLFVLDDRNQVVELWRSLGLTCLQVADGNF